LAICRGSHQANRRLYRGHANHKHKREQQSGGTMHQFVPTKLDPWEGSNFTQAVRDSRPYRLDLVAGCRLRSGDRQKKLPASMELGISGAIGLLLGSVIAWLALRSRPAALQARLSLTEKELTGVKADLARLLEERQGLVASRARLESALEMERKTSNEKIELLTKSGERAAEDLQNAFKALAADALKSNNTSFLQIAQETLKRFQSEAKGDLEARQKAVADLVAPVRDSLNKVDAQIQQIEVARGEAYGDLKAQVQSLITTQKELQ